MALNKLINKSDRKSLINAKEEKVKGTKFEGGMGKCLPSL